MTSEEHWAYRSRYIYINRYINAPKPVYETLLKLVADKDYFVITTNADHCLQKAGFDKKRLFYTQGDYGLFQCSEPMTMNLRSDNKFVEDEVWHRAVERYKNFLCTRAGQKILFLELAVGYNTPVIIKYPFWQMTAKNPYAAYACINQGQAVCPRFLCQTYGIVYPVIVGDCPLTPDTARLLDEPGSPIVPVPYSHDSRSGP